MLIRTNISIQEGKFAWQWLVFTNQQDRSSHITVSSAGEGEHIPNEKEVLASREFLTLKVSQKLEVLVNHEHLVNAVVSQLPELAIWDGFKRDKLPIERLAALAPEKQMIIDWVGC